MACGIYMIQNVRDRKIYIGQSQNLELRRKQHYKLLGYGSHRNIHLQRAFNRDGEGSFDFDIVELCRTEDLNSAEQRYLDAYAGNDCYNICRIAESSRGVKRSAETRAKLSAAKKGKKPSFICTPEILKKKSIAMKRSWALTREKRMVSAKLRAHKTSISLRLRWSKIPKKKPSEEARLRISEAGRRRHIEKPMPREAILRATESRRLTFLNKQAAVTA